MSAAPVLAAVRALAPDDGPYVLAVSGGVDSMVLLDAAVRLLPAARLTVATFDHGTGEAAARAATLVTAVAREHGVRCIRGGGGALPAREAAWRHARWAFLRRVAADAAARVVTAHTRDDQVETVLMRVLREAGARGLAGLYAASPILRPMLPLSRTEVESHARAHRLRWIEDPANRDRRHLRNRVRHDLLPALVRVRPGLREELLSLSSRAAEWRAAMDAVADAACPTVERSEGRLVVAAPSLHGYDEAALAVLWAAIAARVGLALDRRGTRRLGEFTTRSAPGAIAPVSGGWEIVRRAAAFELRRVPQHPSGATPLPLAGALRWGRWCFIAGQGGRGDDHWSARLPADEPLRVRAWRPTDRIAVGTGAPRVKRLLAEGGIGPAERAGWPVVVGRDEVIVWIPGVSRVHAATVRSGRPGVNIRCEPSDG